MLIWKKSMEYLGLGPDDAYDDYDDGPDPEPQARRDVRRATTGVVRASRARAVRPGRPSPRPVR